MRVIAVFTATFLASTVLVTGALVETTNFYPTNGIVNLEVTLAVEGDITWVSDSASAVSLVVTQTDDNPERFNDTIIDYTEDLQSGTATLFIQNINNCFVGGASGWSGNLMVTLGVGLLVSLFMTRCSLSTVCLVLIGVLVAVSSLHASADDCTGRTDVKILVPRNFTFRSLVLTSRGGSIEVDKTLLASEADVTCLSGTRSKVCESCCQANGECVDGECQCRAGFEGDDCGTQTDTTYTLNNDPADPVIITLGSVEGEQLQVLGDKDGDGIASSVESLILDDGEGDPTFVSLNSENSLPDRVSTSSGASIQFEWSDDLSSVHVTAVSPGGQFQVTVNVNLTEGKETGDVKRDVTKSQFAAKSPKKTKRESDGGGVASVPVRVYQCEQPEANARVYGLALLNYDEDDGEWSGEVHYTAVTSGTDGLYYIKISTGEQSTIGQTVEDVCEQVVTVLGYSCTVLMAVSKLQEELICIAVASAAELLTAAVPGDFFVVNRACKTGFRAVRFYCDTFGASLPGGPSIADAICESVSFADNVVDFFETDTIFLQPYAEFPAGNRVDAEGQVLRIAPGTSGVLPVSFTILDNEAEPVITSLTVNPPDPNPQQNYIVYVTYICATLTQSTNMSIIGTDGYSDYTVCYGVSYACTLFVPGAEELVVDLVTIEISDISAGFSFIRQVVVVF